MFISRSASALYCFVSIEPIKVYLTNFSNVLILCSICFLTDSFSLGLGVSALSKTGLAYVFLGMSIIDSFIKSLNLIFFFLPLILFSSIVLQYNFVQVVLKILLLLYPLYSLLM